MSKAKYPSLPNLLSGSTLLTLVKVFVLAAFLVALPQSSVSATQWIDYRFVNHTGYTIKELYITRTGYNNWGTDLLGSSVLSNGESKGLRYNTDWRYWDVKIVFMNNEVITWSHVDYSGTWRKTVYRDGSRYMISNN